MDDWDEVTALKEAAEAMIKADWGRLGNLHGTLIAKHSAALADAAAGRALALDVYEGYRACINDNAVSLKIDKLGHWGES